MKHPKPMYVYILTNPGKTTLYVGVTNDIARRLAEHRSGKGNSFTARYHLTVLIHLEAFERAEDAIAREKQIKRWSRIKKERLIGLHNPQWLDLCEQYGLPGE